MIEVRPVLVQEDSSSRLKHVLVAQSDYEYANTIKVEPGELRALVDRLTALLPAVPSGAEEAFVAEETAKRARFRA